MHITYICTKYLRLSYKGASLYYIRKDIMAIFPYFRTEFVSCFSVIVIVLYAMFILYLWTEIENKHCWYHYDYDNDRKKRYMPPPFMY